MGRSKKNYDHLVDNFGNYGIDISQGIFPGSGLTPGIKGKKGEQGNKGQKGAGEKGQKGVNGTDGVKGIKGVVGPGGIKGQKGEASDVFRFKGSVGDITNLPGDAEPGDVYFVIGEDTAYVWDGGFWINLPGVSELTGDKGDVGPEGPKGEHGTNGLDGPGGQDGEKGDKGDKGEDFDPSLYYDADTINQLLENLKSPEFAFDVTHYQDPTSNVENETIDFLSDDAQGELYNPGMVVINPTCTVTGSPITASRLLVVNYVIDNPGQLRGNGYGILQHVYNADLGTTDGDAYYRRVRPALSQFGAWRKLHFDSENYYNKTEANERNTDYELQLKNLLTPNTHSIRLSDRMGNGQDSDIEVEGRGGISLSNVQGKLIIDGSPLTGQISLLGTISVNDDVNQKALNPAPGQYFIFNDSGTDVNTGEVVANGDWLIYGADPTMWRHLDMSVNYGVSEVRVKSTDSFLNKTGSVQFPELSLDQVAFESEYPSNKTAAGQAAYSHIANNNDVLVDMAEMGQTVTYDDQRGTDDPLTDPGTYYVIPGQNKIVFSYNDANNIPGSTWFGDTVNDPNAKHRLADPSGSWSVTGLVSSAGDSNNSYAIVYKDGNAATAAKSFGQFHLTYFEKYDLEEGDVLAFNDTTEKWRPVHPITAADLINIYLEQATPVGLVSQWFGQQVPEGWFRCDTTSFDINAYPKLHAHLQANYHNYVTGETPDLRGQFLRSAFNSDMENHVYGKKFGHKTGRPYNFDVTMAEAGGHSHQGVTDEDGQHTHNTPLNNGHGAGSSSGKYILRSPGTDAHGKVENFSSEDSRPTEHTHAFGTEVEPSHKHTLTVSGWDSETTPNYVECSFIIKHDYIAP